MDLPSRRDAGSGDPLQPICLVTGLLERDDQFEAWRLFMSPAVEMAIEGDPSAAFAAEQAVWDLGSLALTHAVMPADGRMRVWRHLRRDPLDHWCLVLTGPDAGPGQRGPSGGRSLFVRSLARPFEGRSSDREVLSVYVPRDLFRGDAEAIDRLSGQLVDNPLSALLADHLASLHRRLPDIAARDVPKIVEATRMLIAACLLPDADRIDAARDILAVSLVDRARRIVLENLAAPDFGPQQLCRLLGVSRSRLYRLFEPLGGIAHYIQRQRMLAAHGALTDPRDNDHIVKIAERVGFTDASGFSRAFRQEFGYSPSHARVVASLNAIAPSTRRAPLLSEAAVLADVLGRLGA